MCRLTETRALSAQGEKRALVGNLTMPTYMIAPQIGAGLFVRYMGGFADIPTLGGDVSVDVGGVQTGGGIRVRF